MAPGTDEELDPRLRALALLPWVDAYLRENAPTIDRAILYGGQAALSDAVLQAVVAAIE